MRDIQFGPIMYMTHNHAQVDEYIINIPDRDKDIIYEQE